MFVAAFVAVWTACASGPPPSGSPPDIVLITLDTVRADRIGAYGDREARTPALDALAGRGRRYERVWSPVPLTLPAHASLFTGLLPAEHGATNNGRALPLGEPLLAEHLRAHGYATCAAVGAYVLDRRWGLDRGFDSYLDGDRRPERPERPGAEVVDDALGCWTEAEPGPRFLWVHLYDAHGRAAEIYAEGIAALDLQVGRLVSGTADRAPLVVVVADHGEGLGEHGESAHGLFVYDATQRVPWIVAGPGVAPAVIDTPLSLVDVAAVLLDIVGLPDLAADRPPRRALVMESVALAERFGLAPHRAVVQWPHKLVDVPRPELYDLSRDPDETADLAAFEPDRVAQLRALGGPWSEPEHGALEPEVALQLAALGYADLADAKDQHTLVGAVDTADALAARGQLADALMLLQRVGEAHPDVKEIVLRRAQLLARAGRSDEGLSLLRAAVARDPDSGLVATALATALEGTGRLEEAAETWERLARDQPHLPGVHARAVEALGRLRSPTAAQRATAAAEHFLREHPGDPWMSGLLGVLYARSGARAEASPLLHAAAPLAVPPRDVCRFLAREAHEQGRFDDARALLEREVADYPDNAAAILALALVYEQVGDPRAMLAVLDGALARVAAASEPPPVDLRPFHALRERARRQLASW